MVGAEGVRWGGKEGLESQEWKAGEGKGRLGVELVKAGGSGEGRRSGEGRGVW